jgi:hypothetical protein
VEYTSEATAGIGAIIASGIVNAGKFTFEVQNGDGTPSEIAMPPVLEVVQAMSSDDMMSINVSERLAKWCLMNKITIVKYDGDVIGKMIINDINTPWDAYDFLIQYPLALQFIINACVAQIIKKSIPPRRKDMA